RTAGRRPPTSPREHHPSRRRRATIGSSRTLLRHRGLLRDELPDAIFTTRLHLFATTASTARSPTRTPRSPPGRDPQPARAGPGRPPGPLPLSWPPWLQPG